MIFLLSYYYYFIAMPLSQGHLGRRAQAHVHRCRDGPTTPEFWFPQRNLYKISILKEIQAYFKVSKVNSKASKAARAFQAGSASAPPSASRWSYHARILVLLKKFVQNIHFGIGSCNEFVENIRFGGNSSLFEGLESQFKGLESRKSISGGERTSIGAEIVPTHLIPARDTRSE